MADEFSPDQVVKFLLPDDPGNLDALGIRSNIVGRNNGRDVIDAKLGNHHKHLLDPGVPDRDAANRRRAAVNENIESQTIATISLALGLVECIWGNSTSSTSETGCSG